MTQRHGADWPTNATTLTQFEVTKCWCEPAGLAATEDELLPGLKQTPGEITQLALQPATVI